MQPSLLMLILDTTFFFDDDDFVISYVSHVILQCRIWTIGFKCDLLILAKYNLLWDINYCILF
jgi:hypothetical protein